MEDLKRRPARRLPSSLTYEETDRFGERRKKNLKRSWRIVPGAVHAIPKNQRTLSCYRRTTSQPRKLSTSSMDPTSFRHGSPVIPQNPETREPEICSLAGWLHR